jgi:predicted PurR-regulated permease PerM
VGTEPKQHVTAPRAERHAFYWLATAALLVTIFSHAQEVLVPLALSVVIAFALSPFVTRLERYLGRGLAVALVMLVAIAAVSAFGYLLKRQLVELSERVSKYSESMTRKIASLRGDEGGGLSGLSNSIDKMVHELDQRVAENKEARAVKLIPAEASASDRIAGVVVPVMAPLAKALIVLVLVIFSLGKREDLRDRFIRLVGRRNVTLTTRTLDEAGERISRYLMHQSAINFGFGVTVAVGLLLIGIPYPALWGFLVAVLRFIPFVGTLLAMLLPAMLAFAQYEGWWQTLATIGLFLSLDALAAYVVEPLVIGSKTGVSSIAMLLSAIFWAWLWGPVGLVLATPLTVCLAVLGKHVPRLEFLGVVLSDEPALETELILYQRLLAGDEDESHDILDKQFRALPRQQVFDRVIVPALTLAGRDRARLEISEADHSYLLRTTRALLDGSSESGSRAGVAAGEPGSDDKAPPAPPRAGDEAPFRVLGVAARNATDELICEMLAQLFDPARIAFQSVSSDSLASEVTAAAEERAPDLICLVSTPPGGSAQARYICRRIRARLPNSRILVFRPGIPEGARHGTEKLIEENANGVAFSFEEALTKAEQQVALRQAIPA